MNITVIDTGFVSGDFTLQPIGYAGERNSRKLYITHPHFKDCFYQVLVKRYDGLYKLGIQDGEIVIPPSLLRTATTLECQFVAVSKPESITDPETDTFLFTSKPFNLTVDRGLDISNCEPIPTYEELQQMYKDLNKARDSIEDAKRDNEEILKSIQAALDESHKQPIAEISQEVLDEYRKQFADVCEDYLADGFFDDVTAEVVARIGEMQCGDLCKMTTEELKNLIRDTMSEMKTEVVSGTASWLTTSNHFMSTQNKIIGG